MKHTEKYLQAKWVTENPDGYDERDVIDAKRYCNAYLDGYNQALRKTDVSRRALLSLAQEFRDWQREWHLYDIGQQFVKPKNVVDFVSELEQRYVAEFKHGG